MRLHTSQAWRSLSSIDLTDAAAKLLAAAESSTSNLDKDPPCGAPAANARTPEANKARRSWTEAKFKPARPLTELRDERNTIDKARADIMRK
mmetsp:Transcript_90566/g.143035  ORF Transcript_90566/g.143035 Transcript_90566/m.143035 type:complete len:92 (-) Transcript_90566:28-303(-)